MPRQSRWRETGSFFCAVYRLDRIGRDSLCGGSSKRSLPPTLGSGRAAFPGISAARTDVGEGFGAPNLARRNPTGERLGDLVSNLFARTHHADGDLGVDLGVYGAPETFIVDADGIIRFRHVGDVNDRNWNREFLPILDSLTDG